MIHFKKKTFIVCKTKDDVIRFISEARKRGFSAMFDIENDLKQFDKLGVGCIEVDYDGKAYLSGFTYDMLQRSGYKEIFEVQKHLDSAPFQVMLPGVGWIFRGTDSECGGFIEKCLADSNYNRANVEKMKVVPVK